MSVVPQYIGILKRNEGRTEGTSQQTYLSMAKLLYFNKQNKVIIRYIYLIINEKQGMKRGIGCLKEVKKKPIEGTNTSKETKLSSHHSSLDPIRPASSKTGSF